MPGADPKPTTPPPAGQQWVMIGGKWVLQAIAAPPTTTPPPATGATPPVNPPPGEYGQGKYIKVNGAWTWTRDPNAMYVKGTAEDPMVATERDRQQRAYNAAYYGYMVGGTTATTPEGQSYRVQGTAPDPKQFAVGNWVPSASWTAVPNTTPTTNTRAGELDGLLPTQGPTPTPVPSRFTPRAPARTQNTAGGPAYTGMPASLMPASMRARMNAGNRSVGGWKRKDKKQAI